MPAARYWRAVGLQSVGGGALELSALHLYLGGVRVDAVAILTSTFAPASGSLAALQDGDAATTARWLDVSAPGFALVWDFGAGNAQDVAAVRLGAGALYAEWLETLTLQHSSDGVAWEALVSASTFSWPGAGVLQPVPAGGDPQFEHVSLLLHMDGADGSTAFTDSSPTPKTVTAYANAKISAAQSRWGGASAYCDGSSVARTPASQAWSFGNSDFTIECHFYIDGDSALTAGGTRVAHLITCGPWSGSDTNSWYLALDGSASSTGTGIIFGRKDSAGWESVAANAALTKGAWRHVAVAKSGSTVRIFLDGTSQAAANLVRNTVLGDYELKIGGLGFTPGWEQYFRGYIDEVRITKGVARYTADFVPPTTPFPNAVGGAVPAAPRLRAPTPERARIAASAPVPPHSTLSAPRLLTARDLEFAGTGTASATGTIYGSTAIKGSPNAPVRAKVSLLRARDLLLVQQTWSDPTTGAYAFHGLDPAEKYTTLAEYPTGDRRAVAADQLTPDIEEARAP